MRRWFFIVLGAAALGPQPARAQATGAGNHLGLDSSSFAQLLADFSKRERIRVRTTTGDEFTITRPTLTPDSLTGLSGRATQPFHRLGLQQVTGIQVASRATGKGAKYGAIVGSVLGAVGGAVAVHELRNFGWGQPTRSGVNGRELLGGALVGGTAGTVVGLVVGAIVGAATTKWNDVYPGTPERTDLRTSVISQANRGLGLGVSVAF